MKMTSSVACWFQFVALKVDDHETALVDFVLGNLVDIPDRTDLRWQFGVDSIYRFHVCNLISIQFNGFEHHDIGTFLHAIRTLSPFDNNSSMMWNSTFVSGTAPTAILAEKLRQTCADPYHVSDQEFAKTIEDIFASHNVPWSLTPLLPIIKA